MRNWKKALSCVLTFALCIPALATTAFGALYQSNNGGNYFNYTTFSEEEMTKYVPMVYEVGDNSTATATGYAQFYDTHDGRTADDFFKKNMSFNTDATMDEIHPTGYIKFVIHDGVMVITNELTKEETDAMAKQACINRGIANPTESTIQNGSTRYATANFLNMATASGYGTTPIRENANIETIIFGDNVTSMNAGGAFWKLPNLKNIIFVDGGTGGMVYSNTPIDTVIFNASGDYDMSNSARLDTINKVVYDTPAGGWGTIQSQYKTNNNSVWVNDGTDSVAAQQAEAKALIADMNLPDWALAFLPTEVGGTEQVRTVDEVFNFSTGEMLSDWGGTSTSQSEDETTTVTQPTYTTDSPKVNEWAVQYYNEANGLHLIPTDGVLGSDYTVNITRAQFAALAVTTYERALNTTVSVSAGDDTFADCTGNEYVAKAYNLGILSGYNSADTRSGVYVGPNDLITREQAAVMLTRMMIKYNDVTGGVQPAKAESLPFTDTASSWALDGIATVYEHGIMAGTSATTFDGKANYTIEQAVVTMYRYFNWVGYGVTIYPLASPHYGRSPWGSRKRSPGAFCYGALSGVSWRCLSFHASNSRWPSSLS